MREGKAWNALVVKDFGMWPMILGDKGELETRVMLLIGLFIVIFFITDCNSKEMKERTSQPRHVLPISLSFTLMIYLCILVFIHLSR